VGLKRNPISVSLSRDDSKTPEKQQKKNARDSLLVIPQPKRLHLSVKNIEENFAKENTEFHVPFDSFPMNIYAGGSICT